jgi:hypothetical protein
MSAQSRFGICQINVAPIGFEVRLTKHTQVAAGSRVAYRPQRRPRGLKLETEGSACRCG